MFGNWSDPAVFALASARLIAAADGSAEITLEHVVLGAFRAGRESLQPLASHREAIDEVERDLVVVPRERETIPLALPFSRDVQGLLEQLRAAPGAEIVDLDVLLKAILTTTSGMAAESLERAGWRKILR